MPELSSFLTHFQDPDSKANYLLWSNLEGLHPEEEVSFHLKELPLEKLSKENREMVWKLLKNP